MQAEDDTNRVTADLESIAINNVDMASNFYDMDHTAIRLSNCYYVIYGLNATV